MSDDPKPVTKSLTPKQAAFVREYLVDLNATAAAKRAGYSMASKPSGFYVYFLLDDDDRIIYVGKGKGRRMHQHLTEARSGAVHSKKSIALREMIDAGLSFRPVVFADGLSSSDALSLEFDVISSVGFDDLLNSSHGNHSEETNTVKRIDLMIRTSMSEDQWVAKNGADHPLRKYVQIYWSSLLNLRDEVNGRIARGLPISTVSYVASSKVDGNR